jgi:CBS domain-containing protein
MICPSCGHDNLPGDEACGRCRQSLTPLDQPAATNRVERCLMHDTVAQLPVRPPVMLSASTTVREAIRVMLETKFGVVLVVDEAGKLLGIFGERDLLDRVAGLGNGYMELPIGPLATSRPVTVSPAETLNFVLHKMDGGGYRHLPVVQAGKPVSIISVRDMLIYITKTCRE